jgi:hypothetical protein
MYFKQFSRKLSTSITGHEIQSQFHCYNHLIEKTVNGSILIDGETTSHQSIDEARDYLCQVQYSEHIEQDLAKDMYEELADITVADIIREYHDVKITDTLIESYRELAASKIFTVDPIAQRIRELNSFDYLIENKIDYQLNDGSIIAISKETQSIINNLLQNNKDVVTHMRESKENFLSVIDMLKE